MRNQLEDKNNVMLDLETMGTGSMAAIVAVGAVRFDHDSILSRFYAVVDLQSSMALGLNLDASTVMWWLNQSKEAREELLKEPVHINQVLGRFSAWVGEDPVVWGNGVTFDNVILSNAYELASIRRPWSYKNDRCYRTLKAGYPEVPYVDEGIYHKAVDDAENQALTLINCLKGEVG